MANVEADLKLLDEVLDSYAGVEGSLITILQKAQDLYGYLSERVMEYISQRTKISKSKIYGVVTFYAQFRLTPAGKYTVMMCQGTACHVNGSQQIKDSVCEHLNISDGETTADGIFTMKHVACLGCCSLAPVMTVAGKGFEETYGSLTENSALQAIEDIRKEAQS